jgi:hypothetical protein
MKATFGVCSKFVSFRSRGVVAGSLLFAALPLPILSRASFAQGMDTPTPRGEGVENEGGGEGEFTSRTQAQITRDSQAATPENKGRTLQQQLGISSLGVPQLERALGVQLGDVEVRIEDYNMPTGIRYTILKTVYPDKLAARSGLKAGDMVVSCNGRAVNGGNALAAIMGQLPLQSTAVWEVARGDEPLEVRFLVNDLARSAFAVPATKAKTTEPLKPKSSFSKTPSRKPVQATPFKSAPARELNRMLESLKGL